jgi:chitinase
MYKIIRYLVSLVLLSGMMGSSVFADEPIVLGYYMAWSKSVYPHTLIPYDKVTHIAHAFVWPNANGSLSTYDYLHYPQLIQTAGENGVIMILSVGGWGNSDGFGPMVADTSARKRFIADLIAFCQTNGYQGIDLDWEYPGSADRANFVKLVQELRDAISQLDDPMSISIALPSSDWRSGYDIYSLRDLVDWFGIMTYDFHGSWTNHSGHVSPLYPPPSHLCQDGSLDQSVKYYLQHGVPKSKLVVGMATYGRVFNTGGLYQQPTSSDGNGAAVSYTEAINRINQGWTYNWDDTSKMPYLVNPSQTQLVAFEDTVSFRHKTDYIRANGLRGAKVWALSYDMMPDGHPLMETLFNNLNSVTGIRSEPVPSVPGEFGLYQNYPNPFNGQTTIRFAVGSKGDNSPVLMRVFDVLGREVTTLVDERIAGGVYAVNFIPGVSLSSGIYLYRLDIDGKSNVRTMLYLK